MPESVSISPKLKRWVAERAGGICEYCRCPEHFSTTPFSVEHIIPRILGGTHEPENLAFACRGCNNIKFVKTNGIDPETNLTASLFHPRQHIWQEQFCWDDSLLNLTGLTPIGRATIEALKLNREEVRNLRRVLFLIGEHPPREKQC